MRLHEIIPDAARAVPTRSFPELWHVGTLDPASKRDDSYEGAGLSVSLNPAAWRRIARGMVAGDLFRCTKASNRFIDAHRLTKRQRATVADWSVSQGLAGRATLWRISWHDEDIDDTVSMEFSDRAEAEAEAEGMGGEIEEIAGGLVGTPRLAMLSRVSRVDPVMVPDLLLPLYAESLGMDGVWWQDRLDVMAYSAPRGVIVPAMFPTWSFEKVPQQSGPSEIED